MKKIIVAILLFFLILPSNVGAVSEVSTTAKACVVMEANSGRMLYEKNSSMELPLASTTKILTALVVAEQNVFDDVVCVPRAAVGVEGSSIYLREGEHLTVRELLYGLMLQSGNDCATALALHVGKSIENFSEMMNKKALELGCKNSHFTNPHGLHSDQHFTSAYDLGLISCAAMNNADVKEIVSTKKKKISNEGFDYDRVISNKNKILSLYEGANGLKTGFTKAAGRCFVGASERAGMQLVIVLLNCGPMFEDSMSIMDYFHNNFEMKDMLASVAVPKEIDVKRGKEKTVDIASENKCLFPLKKDGSEDNLVSVQANLCKTVTAPVLKNSCVGKISVSFDKELIFSTKIVTLNEVKKANIFDFLFPSER